MSTSIFSRNYWLNGTFMLLTIDVASIRSVQYHTPGAEPYFWITMTDGALIKLKLPSIDCPIREHRIFERVVHELMRQWHSHRQAQGVRYEHQLVQGHD